MGARRADLVGIRFPARRLIAVSKVSHERERVHMDRGEKHKQSLVRRSNLRQINISIGLINWYTIAQRTLEKSIGLVRRGTSG